ncbi:hypothetical protein AALP_AAs40902U000200 [Arabis alpina]|uniref:Uncharacterized protein n=1 Tax=Arabis alpina TaxID=50452 RepID=A0A087FWD9_ARAAL|nr:hypothetical protein AALP_AAs40902U000200 [Arabis alpina]
MQVGRDPGYPITWFPRANESEECLGGVDGVTKAFEFSIDKRSVLFLTSSPALEKSSIWGYKMSVSDAIAGDGSIGNDALESFHAAMADTPASVVALSPQSEQQTSEVSLKRCAITAGISRQPPRNTKKKSPVTSGGSILAASDHSTTLVALRKQVFSRDRDTFNDLGHATILEKSQIHLMEVMSVCHYVKAELDATKEEVTRLKEANHLLRKDKEAEITRCNSLIAVKEAESATLRTQVDDLISQLRSQTTSTEQLQQDLGLTKKKLRASGPAATIRCRWKMVQEYRMNRAKHWDALLVEKQFREVETLWCELNEEVPPVFPEAFTVFPEMTHVPSTSTE